ncbi:MAG: HupE/UreJ family protein [Gammaproteobacteria bacterium]|jgi:urease accessory protein|nr:HupE/UreJ family protein [Gammaproteobacteria bacterium]
MTAHRSYSIYLAAAMTALVPDLVFAHDGASLPYGSFLGGLTHPVLGLDHFLAMVSVGIVSVQIGGRAIWTVPATFVVIMALGGLLGYINVGLSAIETGIAASVLVLGGAIAMDKKVPVVFAMCAVAIFAVFHGYAHGAEMPAVANPYTYVAGFMTGTIILHLMGVVVGDISQHYEKGKLLLRIAGAAIAGTGAWFLVGAA